MWNSLEISMKEIIKEYSDNNYDTDSGTGCDEATIECEKLFSQEASFGAAKSKVMAYILENCPVEVCSADIFADKLQNYNILQQRVSKDISSTKSSVMENITDSKTLFQAGAIEPLTDFGHIAPDWGFVIENGIPGIIERLEKYKESSINKDFYDNSLRVYRAIITFMLRLADTALKNGSKKGKFIAENLTALTKHAPKTLPQAMQLTFIIYAVQTKLEGATVRSLGGLDRLYSNFYYSDLESGRYTDSQLREIIRYFYFRISAMKVVANMPFYICGTAENGSDATNGFTYILLEEYAKLDIYDPKIHVMYHQNIDKSLLKKITELIKNGKNSFVFVNTDIASAALRNIGISEEDSRKVIVYGCYETASEGKELPSTCAGLINMPKILDMFIHCGTDIINDISTKKKPSCDYKSFEEFHNGFLEYLKYCITVCMDTISGYEKHYFNIFTAPVLSATFGSCVEKGTDIFSGGAKYNNTSIVCACLASVADSLAAVKKLVYETKTVSLDKLREILSSNWEDAPELYKMSKHNCPKFANNDDNVDSIASELCSYLSEKVINGYKNGRGGIFRFGSFSIDWRFRFGKGTAALPNGHKLGDPLSKNMSADVGCDKNGVTAFLNSVLKIDSTKIPDGCVADVMLHSSCTSGDEGTAAILGLITSFMQRGGFAIQFNVISEEILRKAQQTPDKYKNLQVRVCGWNARFINLTKKEQDEFILQSEQS